MKIPIPIAGQIIDLELSEEQIKQLKQEIDKAENRMKIESEYALFMYSRSGLVLFEGVMKDECDIGDDGCVLSMWHHRCLILSKKYAWHIIPNSYKNNTDYPQILIAKRK